MDFGEHILKNISSDGFFSKNKLDIVTSVYPSTTTAALTTYYSGRPPFETGWIAWSQYFKEYGRALDMLPRKESYYGDKIKNPRMDVFETVVNYETIFERIEKASKHVKAFELLPTYAEKRSNRSLRAENIDDVINGIEDLLEMSSDNFIFAYVDNPDGLLHKFGTDSEEAKNYILETEKKIQELCKGVNEDTLVIISADHGHKNIEKVYQILDYPEINECLIMPVSLESRAVTFWVKENMKKEFEERFKNAFGDEFLLMTREEFLEKHFLGYGEKHPKIEEFIGNYIALSVAGSIIRLETYLAEGKTVKKSTHCGLTKEEMEVPVIVAKK